MPLPWSSKGVGRSKRDKPSLVMHMFTPSQGFAVPKCMWCFTDEYEREIYSRQNDDSNHSDTPKHGRAEVPVHIGGEDVGTVDFQPHS